MTTWADINYRGFWDVPRVFLVRHNGELILFDCPFDEVLEDDSDTYQVYVMPEIANEELPDDWTTLAGRALRRLGEIPVTQVQFDPTRRRQIDTSVLDTLISQPARLSG